MEPEIKHYFPKLMRLGGNNKSYALLIPKVLIKKYYMQDEERLLLEENEGNKTFTVKRIGTRTE